MLFHQPLSLKVTKMGLLTVYGLGGFQKFMNFISSMGTMMKGSRLAGSFEISYVKPTVRQMFAGKPVTRALRGHCLVEAVLRTKLLRHLFPTDYSFFQEVDELLTDEEQDSAKNLRDIEFNEDDCLPDVCPNEADILEIKKL